MPYRLAIILRKKILLRDISDIFSFVILCKQMIERLILLRPNFFRDGQPPLFSICENRVDVENDAAEREQAVFYHLADLKFCFAAMLFHDSLSSPTMNLLTRIAMSCKRRMQIP
jgi:hypothetical protein